jgi:hypothetical protein
MRPVPAAPMSVCHTGKSSEVQPSPAILASLVAKGKRHLQQTAGIAKAGCMSATDRHVLLKLVAQLFNSADSNPPLLHNLSTSRQARETETHLHDGMAFQQELGGRQACCVCHRWQYGRNPRSGRSGCGSGCYASFSCCAHWSAQSTPFPAAGAGGHEQGCRPAQQGCSQRFRGGRRQASQQATQELASQASHLRL